MNYDVDDDDDDEGGKGCIVRHPAEWLGILSPRLDRTKGEDELDPQCAMVERSSQNQTVDHTAGYIQPS